MILPGFVLQCVEQRVAQLRREPDVKRALFGVVPGNLLHELLEGDRLKLLEVEPESVGERMNLAIAYERNEQVDSAIVEYERVLELQPENFQLYCNLAYLYGDVKKAARAVEVAKQGLEIKSGDACLLCAWAKALEKLADYEGAIAKFQMVVNDPQWGDYAVKQIDRQKKLIQRREAIKERDELGY